MTALHLRILGSTAGHASNLPITSLQPRDTSIGINLEKELEDELHRREDQVLYQISNRKVRDCLCT